MAALAIAQQKLGDMVRRDYRLMVTKATSSAELRSFAGALARTRIQQLISQGSASPNYVRYVDGREDAPEESVKIPGNIIYVFARIAEAAEFGLSFVRNYSIASKKTGAYASAWMLFVEGQQWSGPVEKLPRNTQQVIIVNPAPYARRLEQSSGRFDARYQVTEYARRAIAKQYPGLAVARKFVTLSRVSSVRWPVPYEREHEPRGPINYPAVVISVR